MPARKTTRPGSVLRTAPRPRYDSRKSWPHPLMQCASSIATRLPNYELNNGKMDTIYSKKPTTQQKKTPNKKQPPQDKPERDPRVEVAQHFRRCLQILGRDIDDLRYAKKPHPLNKNLSLTTFTLFLVDTHTENREPRQRTRKSPAKTRSIVFDFSCADPRNVAATPASRSNMT